MRACAKTDAKRFMHEFLGSQNCREKGIKRQEKGRREERTAIRPNSDKGICWLVRARTNAYSENYTPWFVLTRKGYERDSELQKG